MEIVYVSTIVDPSIFLMASLHLTTCECKICTQKDTEWARHIMTYGMPKWPCQNKIGKDLCLCLLTSQCHPLTPLCVSRIIFALYIEQQYRTLIEKSIRKLLYMPKWRHFGLKILAICSRLKERQQACHVFFQVHLPQDLATLTAAYIETNQHLTQLYKQCATAARCDPTLLPLEK